MPKLTVNQVTRRSAGGRRALEEANKPVAVTLYEKELFADIDVAAKYISQWLQAHPEVDPECWKSLFDQPLVDVAEWLKQDICPKCLEDNWTGNDPHVCNECGFCW